MRALQISRLFDDFSSEKIESEFSQILISFKQIDKYGHIDYDFMGIKNFKG